MHASFRWAFLAFVVAATARAENTWDRFRGPNGSGGAAANAVPLEFPNGSELWNVQLGGVGHSSPVVWEQLLVVTAAEEETGQRFVVGLDARGGVRKWKLEYGQAHHRKHKLNSFASSTPAIDATHVYLTWGTPEHFFVLAVDHNGREVWKQDLGPYRAGHGEGVSPIVQGSVLVIAKEHEGPSELVGLHKATGEILWRVARESKSTWSTPCVRTTPDGKSEVIFVNWNHGITAIDPETGQSRWEADVFDKGHVESSISSPVLAGELVLGVSGWLSVRQELVAVRPPRSGDEQPSKVYTIDRGVPLCTTPLVVGELLFLWADEGIVTCADAQTGKTHWRKRVGGTYYSSPIAVGDRVYNVSADGEVVVLQADSKYRLLGRSDLGGVCHSTPAVAWDRLYLRTSTQLFCFGP